MINFYRNIVKIRFDPNYVDAIFNKGDILVQLNRIQEGIDWMSKAIQIKP